MPAPKQYSNLARYKKAEVYDSEQPRWIVDMISLSFIFGAFALALQMIFSYQNDIVTVGGFIYQMIMLFGGLSIGIVVSISGSRIGIRVGFPTRESLGKWLMYTIVLFLGTMILNAVLGSAFMSSIADFYAPMSATGNKAISVFISAVVEEVVYTLAFGILLFRIITYAATGIGGFGIIQQYVALFIAAVLNGFLFWAIHYFVYGTELGMMIMLITNRIIYAFLFYVTRDLKFPMALHILHNLMVVL